LLIGALALPAVLIAIVLAGGEPGPATGAAELVPGNALLYVHLSTDPTRPAVKRALALRRRLPDAAPLLTAVTDRVDAILGGSPSAAVNFATDVRPWLGKEAALAVLDTSGSRAGSLIVLDVRSRAAARSFLVGVGASPDGSYRGVPLLAQPSGAVLAFVRHYMVLGQRASVRAAVDASSGRAPSLAKSGDYLRAADGEPADRVLDAYASADGIRRALIPRSGLLGDLGALLDQPPLAAATVSVSALSSGLRVHFHSALVPRLAQLRAYRPAQFTPTLAGLLPARSILLVDVKGLRASMPKLLAVAARAGIAGRIGPLLSRLGSALVAQGVDLGPVLGIFSGETAVAITPGRGGGGPAPVIVTRAPQQRSRALLAGLEAPLAQVFTPSSAGPGQVPEVSDTQLAGVPVHELSLAPGFGLDYAVARGLVVISTSPAGVAGVFRHAGALGEESGFQGVLANHPGQVTSLVFSNLGQLLRLGEQTGLIGSTHSSTLWSALEQIRAVGLASWRGADDTTTELQLQIR
jgi:hypothetical protein